MPFRVNFIGLTYFHDEGNENRLVLLPDGRPLPAGEDPCPGIDEHFAKFFVETSRVRDLQGWSPDKNEALGDVCVSAFSISSPATITITAGREGRRRAGRGRTSSEFDASQHDNFVATLDPRVFLVEPGLAKSIARLTIDEGTLEAYVFGKGDDLSVTAQWTVTGNRGPYTVTAHTDDGTRSFVVEDWTELVLGNTADLFGEKYGEEPVSHFKLYGRLDYQQRCELLEEPPVPALAPLPAGHPYLRHVLDSAAHVPSPGCSIIRGHRRGHQGHRGESS